jgi:hypothetical protein
MMFGEIIAFYSENYMKSTNTLCGQTTDLLNIKAGYIYIVTIGFQSANQALPVECLHIVPDICCFVSPSETFIAVTNVT